MATIDGIVNQTSARSFFFVIALQALHHVAVRVNKSTRINDCDSSDAHYLEHVIIAERVQLFKRKHRYRQSASQPASHTHLTL